ncbi:hypothetical protein AOLI_G00177950 [Acnodon oligacanthus]
MAVKEHRSGLPHASSSSRPAEERFIPTARAAGARMPLRLLGRYTEKPAVGYDTATAQSCRPVAAAALLARPFKRPGDGDAPGPPAGAGGLLSTPCFTESVLKSLFTAPAAPSPAAVPPKSPAGVPERFADALWETRRAGRGMQPVANEDEACKHDPPSAPLRD